METAIATAIVAIFQIWSNHAGKPDGWKPSQQDIDDLLGLVDAASPEAEKAAARLRLGLPPI